MRCTRCSPGCDRCWHLRTADRLCNNIALPQRERAALAGLAPPTMRERELVAPMITRDEAVIGVQFMGDIFHEAVQDGFRDEVFAIMALCPQHTYLMLTKRPYQMAGYMNDATKVLGRQGMIRDAITRHFLTDCNLYLNAAKERVSGRGWSLPNVYMGITVCNQDEWDAKKDYFLSVPGLKFISHEPALGLINFGPRLKEIACLISGGETSKGARPSHPDTFRADRDQCTAAGTAFFFKQWGEWIAPNELNEDFKNSEPKGASIGPERIRWLGIDGSTRVIGKGLKRRRDQIVVRVGRKTAGRLLDGQEHNALPWGRS